MTQQYTRAGSVRGFIEATHFGPTVLVVAITFLLSLAQFSVLGSLEVAAAIFAGQCVVGWSNDLIDYPLDAQATRMNKPLVAGKVQPSQLKPAIATALIIAMVLSLVGPLGFKGSAIHALGLLSATAYNFRLKKTRLSVAPYVISFGALPWAIFLGAGKEPSVWLYLAFILFASAFHFLNVMKDLDWDISQGILGLPQLLGRKRSITVAAALLLCGVLVLIFKWRTMLGK